MNSIIIHNEFEGALEIVPDSPLPGDVKIVSDNEGDDLVITPSTRDEFLAVLDEVFTAMDERDKVIERPSFKAPARDNYDPDLVCSLGESRIT